MYDVALFLTVLALEATMIWVYRKFIEAEKRDDVRAMGGYIIAFAGLFIFLLMTGVMVLNRMIFTH